MNQPMDLPPVPLGDSIPPPRGEGFACPECGGRGCSIWKLPCPSMVHWVLNPGCAVLELLAGLRVPSRIYICHTCEEGGDHCQYVQCRGCSAVHDATIWSKGDAFGNWLGPACPDCGKPIPCLWSVASLCVLIVTAPIWWPLWRMYRVRYLAWCRQRSVAARARRIEEHLMALHRCPTCRYDLRASKDQCPECGTPVPAKASRLMAMRRPDPSACERHTPRSINAEGQPR